jgi:Protein of unknown function (DUF4058)
MPLHDWTSLTGWDGVHQVWIVELLYWIKPRLPVGYRAYIGTTPTFAIGAPGEERPDMGVRTVPRENGSLTSTDVPPVAAPKDPAEEPDLEIAVNTLTGETALFVECQDRLIAAVELVSPRNKNRPSACAAYASAYVGYLLKGVHLLLVDVHRRPLRFSFADWIAQELHIEQPACPAPFAISYRLGEPAPNGGRFLAVWHRLLTVGTPLPLLRLPLSVKEWVPVDLEQTYGRATAAAYLS